MLIKEACLPVVYQIEQLDNQNIAWERIFGSRRSKTLRNRFRAWKKYRMWLVASTGVVWPRDGSLFCTCTELASSLCCMWLVKVVCVARSLQQ